MSSFPKGRKNTPKGQMSSSGAGPAIQMMPPHIRATFMPDPPLKHLPNPARRRPKQYVDPDETKEKEEPEEGEKKEGDQSATEPRTANGESKPGSSTDNPRCHMPKVKGGLTGVGRYLAQFERTPPPPRKVGPTPQAMKQAKLKKLSEQHEEKLQPKVEAYRAEQKESGGEYEGMNCYNTLFVGRLAYEVTERKLLREMEAFGPVKDLRLIREKQPNGNNGNNGNNGDNGDQNEEVKSRGYAFVEYEHEEDMKRAYRSADGMRIEGRTIVVDVERGHTVPNWLPRRLGGGLGGTRLGGKDKNFSYPGRFDPSKPRQAPTGGMMMGGGGSAGGPGGGPPPGPPPGYGYGGDRGGRGRGRYDDRYDDRRGGPPPGYYDDRRGGRYDDRRGGGGYYDDRRGGGGSGGYYDDRDRKRRRSRSRSPDRDRDRRRGRY